ncbi:hypothetical protein [Streptomyces sp. SID9913]|uniref:hypothetical protein n=1 Tax=Streptomyces sp. SID9913 TaxID=2706117 RepID=UPI0019434C4C|nr:hypothetical protein [Streptomyces sp. SID9913]
MDTLKVDLVVGRTLAGTPETRTLQSAVDVAWPVDWPEVRLHPFIDHIADKICPCTSVTARAANTDPTDTATWPTFS